MWRAQTAIVSFEAWNDACIDWLNVRGKIRGKICGREILCGREIPNQHMGKIASSQDFTREKG
jgi:hypothetical protein